jgi:methionine-rich copper-binding protein CopC
MKRLCSVLFVGLLAGVTFVAPVASTPPHFALRSSQPEADATVSSVGEIRLRFTEAPQENSAQIRLVAPSGDPVETSDVASDASDGAVVFVSVDSALPAGAYTVVWRGIGDDGHVVRGEFGFTVSAQH